MNHFLVNAKMNTLNPKKVKNYIEGNTQQYGMLGSQNALASVPPKPVLEVKIDLPKEATKTTFVKPTEPPETETQFKPKGTETKFSKDKVEEIKENIEEPKESPPFDLNTSVGKTQLTIWITYLKTKYGDASRLEQDKVKSDSFGFSLAVTTLRQLNKEITTFNYDRNRRWSEWFNNLMVDYGNQLINVIGDVAKARTGQTKTIDALKEILSRFTPTKKQDFVNEMKNIQHEILKDNPSWRNKWNAMSEKAIKEAIANMGGFSGDTIFPPNK